MTNASIYVPDNLSPELLASWPAPLQDKIRPAIRAAAASRRDIGNAKVKSATKSGAAVVTIPSVGPDRSCWRQPTELI
jgi:hypothetical protein